MGIEEDTNQGLGIEDIYIYSQSTGRGREGRDQRGRDDKRLGRSIFDSPPLRRRFDWLP